MRRPPHNNVLTVNQDIETTTKQEGAMAPLGPIVVGPVPTSKGKCGCGLCTLCVCVCVVWVCDSVMGNGEE